MFTDVSMPFGLMLRKKQADDQEFIECLFTSTRAYLYSIPAPKSQIDFLIKQQFQMQQSSYATMYPASEAYIIQLYSQPVGKILLNDSDTCIHIIDFALVSDMQGKGFGSAILRALKQASGKPLQLAVDQQNIRAKKLYLTLGFTIVESSATHDTLLWC